jgi:hypothetical protein
VHAWYAENGVNMMRAQCGDDGLSTGQVQAILQSMLPSIEKFLLSPFIKPQPHRCHHNLRKMCPARIRHNQYRHSENKKTL